MRKPREPKRRKSSLLRRFDKINLEFFGGLLCAGIGWRNFPLGKDDDPITQAAAYFDERFIKVNPVLDDTRIPLWYLDFVIYHEMLHLQHGPQQYSEDGYAYPHNIRFQCMEASHPSFKKAAEFEAKRLPRITQRWRRWQDWKRVVRLKKPVTTLRLAAKRS